MAQWIVGYVLGAYVSNATITLTPPAPIRRIVSGFYTDRPGGVVGPPVALAPHVTNAGDNNIQLLTQYTVKIQIGAGLTNPVIYLLVETELEYPSKNQTPP
jgi:hypothetical protein